MKVSLPLQADAPCLPANSDSHADASKMPRFSSPISFLTKRTFLAIVTLMSFAAVGQTTAQGASSTCVCNYDADKDYFPVKLSPDYAQFYAIEYHKSYKKITITTDVNTTATFYAYLCGTPQPAEATAANAIQIPIDSVVSTSTTQVPYVSYLGKRSSIQYASVAVSGMNACLGKLALANLTAGSPLKPEIVKEIAIKKTGEVPDVYFSGADFGMYKSYTPAIATTLTNFGNHTKVVPIVETQEKTPLAILEWTELVASLYNAEGAAKYVVSSINSRYNCVKDMVKDLPKKKVMWGNRYGASPYSFGTCPNYYCKMIEDAGGIMIGSDISAPTEEQVIALANEADVWIYNNNNYESGQSSQFVASAALAATKVFTDEKVFDILASHVNDWFEERPAQPDVLLMDMVQALHGNSPIADTRKRRFLRNVFTEEKASQGPRDPATCTDANAPLYTDWLEGPCLASPNDLGYIEPILCPAPTQAPTSGSSIMDASWTMVLAALVMMLNMVL